MKAIVIYGSGPQDTEELTPIEVMNVGAGVEIFKELSEKKKMIILTGGKTGRSSLSEAEVMTKKLVQLGIPQIYVVPENQAKNTIENVVFVTNIVDKIIVDEMKIDCLVHVAPREHLSRIEEICTLVGVDGISEFRSSQEILGNEHPLVKKATQSLCSIVVNEPRWMRGLTEIPEYWLPQAAKIEELKRFRYILGHERIKRWLKKNFSLCKVNDLTDREIGEIREKIKKMERVMP